MSSLGIWRQRVRPKLAQSYSFHRGNVPEYISIVEPMPLHERPWTGTSSGYESYGISVVTEDLLVSAGTREQEIADSGEESGAELDPQYRSVLLDDVDTKAVDVNDASQEAMFSSRSSFDKLELDGDTLLDTEEAGIDRDDNMSPNTDDEHGVIDFVEHLNVENRMSSSLINENHALFDKTLNLDEKSENSDNGDFDESYLNEIVYESDISKVNRRVDVNRNVLEDVGDYKNTGLATDFDQEKREQDEDIIQGITEYTEEPDQSENSLQVTFSDSLTTSRQLSTNASDDGKKTERLTSILKNREKNKTYEHELDPSIMKKMTSPSETKKIPSQPTMARRSADLRPQCKPEIAPSQDTEIKVNNKLSKPTLTTGQGIGEDLSDEEGSNSDLYSSTGTTRRRKPKPKSSIYGKRANMKPPRQRLRKRKGSHDDETGGDDVIMSAESALVMEQILEQEKRLKEGMNPWLKGRLSLSQQNSRFEIPMDVRLLETMTPMEYLTKYCIISKRRKALYKHVFLRVDKNRDGVINFSELEKGLTDVHTGILDGEHVNNIVQMVLINKESEFDLKQFSAVAAFSERISCKDHLPVEMLDNFDSQKEIIECADFFALSWKLDGIQVNPYVRKILDSL